jgi:hypothetical protein
MTLPQVSGLRKLAVWRTVQSCYATVFQNLGQVVRICWLWLLIMVPVYAAAHWFVSYVLALPGLSTVPQWVHVGVAELLPVVELPFLASIAVAWHRLVLRHERVSAPVYLRLDAFVWRYVLYSLGFLAVIVAPVLCAMALIEPLDQLDPETLLLQALASRTAPTADPAVSVMTPVYAIIIAAVVGLALTMAIAIFLLPRLSIVLPTLALGERLSMWAAWRVTRGNALRLASANCLCMLPALFLILWAPLLSLLLLALSSESIDIRTAITGVDVIDRLIDTIPYAVFNSVAYALLTIFAVTLLSLTYRFFVPPREDG